MRDEQGNLARYHESESEWIRSFAVDQVKCLVVCRGPVRLEAFEVFDEIGIREYGMLLSEKDSVTYPRCLAPELRTLRFPNNVHRVADYMGVGQEEKLERIHEIIQIAKDNGYTHIFAGYGFMAEDAEFIEALEEAGVGFIGPSSKVVRQAGAKDEAKKLARGLGNAVIPGIDNVSALALVDQVGDKAGLDALAKKHALSEFRYDDSESVEENAEGLLQAGYGQSLELVTIEELQKRALTECREIWKEYPNHRIRFKHIGGGGGKGQRVVRSAEEIESAVMNVLAEVKVLDPGTNRNFLIELNIESTRHNEIQLIGNGDWSLSLGGRDCSVQMHEQKLVEVSLTRELLDVEAAAADGKAREVLEGDKGTLERMELEGERFGEATGLDSVSTFECIVEGFHHFFMEMNTRIQVEHGVTELVYSLEFANPANPQETFVIDRLIEAMVLLALHGKRVPKPKRVPRSVSGLELRINATNQALQPHAGGLIRSWTPPLDREIRFDQGIGEPNPDTGSFVYYALAGAYDSNVALVLSDGATRRENYERMHEMLRCMELRGDELQTNLPVHYGLMSWFLGQGIMAEPDTRFMESYLAGVGALQRCVNDLDLEVAAAELVKRQPDAEASAVLAEKQTLLLRPLERLLANPHQLGGFLGLFDGTLWRSNGSEVVFAENPIRFLKELYHYLNMEEDSVNPPSEKIWEHDHQTLQAGLAFYREVSERTGEHEWSAISAGLEGNEDARLSDGDEAQWHAIQAAHRGFQVGLELLLLIPRIGLRSEFASIRVEDDLTIAFPERFLDGESQKEDTKALAPPPPASADEIVTPMGGAFYAREAPHLPLLADVGTHFEAGEPLFIIEVMKMFNKVLAPFAGTVTENLMAESDGSVVKKGQAIFKIEPDERVEEESEQVVAERRKAATLALL